MKKLIVLFAFLFVGLIANCAPISVPGGGGGGTTYDSTTPIEVQKASIGTSTVPLEGELVTKGGAKIASGGQGLFNSLSVGTKTNGSNGEIISPYFQLKSGEFISPTKYTANNANSNGGSNSVIFGWNNTIGGYAGTSILGGTENYVNGERDIVGSGYSNYVTGGFAGIFCGYDNTVSNAYYSSILTGYTNSISSAYYSSIVGGQSNQAKTNPYQFIGGGYGNTVQGTGTIILGGINNVASGPYASILGGYNNKIDSVGASCSTILGGRLNTVTAEYVVCGGSENTVSGGRATVFGTANSNSGSSSFVSGHSNSNNQHYGFVGAGTANSVTGATGCIVGGRSNSVAGDYVGFIGGGYNNKIKAGVSGIYRSESCTIPGGNGAEAKVFGQFSHAVMPFSTPGDSQHSILINSALTTDDTLTSLSLNRGRDFEGNTFPYYINYIATNSVWVGDIKLAAIATGSGQLTYGLTTKFRIKHKSDGTIDISTGTTEIFADTGLNNCYINIDSIIASSAWKISVVGSSTAEMRWTAVIDYVETVWP